MKPRLILLVVIMLIITTSACSPAMPASTPVPTVPPAPPTIPLPPITATDPASVVIAYYGALSVKNVDAAMEIVAENPELCYPECLTDKDQARAFWEHELLSYIPYVSVLEVNGNTITYAYTVIHNGRVDGYGTGKIIVENGKVKSDH